MTQRFFLAKVFKYNILEASMKTSIQNYGLRVVVKLLDTNCYNFHSAHTRRNTKSGRKFDPGSVDLNQTIKFLDT